MFQFAAVVPIGNGRKQVVARNVVKGKHQFAVAVDGERTVVTRPTVKTVVETAVNDKVRRAVFEGRVDDHVARRHRKGRVRVGEVEREPRRGRSDHPFIEEFAVGDGRHAERNDLALEGISLVRCRSHRIAGSAAGIRGNGNGIGCFFFIRRRHVYGVIRHRKGGSDRGGIVKRNVRIGDLVTVGIHHDPAVEFKARGRTAGSHSGGRPHFCRADLRDDRVAGLLAGDRVHVVRRDFDFVIQSHSVYAVRRHR